MGRNKMNLDLLNEWQLEAVKTTNGPLLILAGAGSGKTRVLTYRVAYLINEEKIDPYNVLAITFTNKAAKEMKDRIIGILGFKALGIQTHCKDLHIVAFDIRIDNKHGIY